MEVEKWKLQSDLCRCCHSEGSFKNLGLSWFNDEGKVEVYSLMLKEHLGITVTPVEGFLSKTTYTICETCVARLQDVTNFKQQVLTCEEKFKEMISKNLFTVEPFPEVKIEIDDNMKVEDDTDGFNDLFSDEECEEKGAIEIEIKREGSTTRAKGKGKSIVKRKLPAQKKKITKKATKPKKVKLEESEEKVTTKRESSDTAANKAEKKKGDNGPTQSTPYYTIEEAPNGAKTYECFLCHKTYAAQALVSQHYRFVHLKKRPRERKCPKCDVKIPAYLKAYHLEEAHGVPAPTCGACGKKFRFPCHVLQHHKKVHMGERTVACTVCGKCFFNKLSLKVHMLLHSSERRYKCDVCWREFRWESNLKDHLRIHSGDRRYVCGSCQKAFVQKSSLKQHVLRNHPGCDVNST